jgi:uncharacterized protein (DUF305 family)
MTRAHRALSSLVAVAAFTALGACSSDSSSTATTAASEITNASGETTTAAEPATDKGNKADVAFMMGMIPHHQQAVEMAELALADSADAGAAVKDLAARIKAAQGPEIDQMAAVLTAWGYADDLAHLDHMGDMSHGEGMMTDEEMAALEAATGDAFDALWLDMMIRHHSGAINQAIVVQTDGSDAATKALADEVIATQQAEIAEMQALLEG